jgi:xanthine dehydrogenase accessory factor
MNERTPALDILAEILSALESEDSVILATVISTSGSTPASALSKMLVRDHGKSWCGTVGGGCMEGDVLEAARALYEQPRAKVLTFHLNEDEMVQGLICGGSLDVLIEPITREQIPVIREMKTLRDEGEDCIIATAINASEKIGIKHLINLPRGLDGLTDQWKRVLSNHPAIQIAARELAEETGKAHHRNETRRLKLQDGELILEPMIGQPNLIIFGGGHVSKSISRAASMVGFRVTIVDDRKEYANQTRFPEASETLAVEFYSAFDHLTVKPSTYIVIVTRGHRSDEEILERALKTPAKYIGMIGSKRKVLTTYERLAERGTRVADLRLVHAPMGIEIGAVTTEEIGISVVAQLIHARRGDSLPLKHKSEEMDELLGYLHFKQSGRIGKPT